MRTFHKIVFDHTKFGLVRIKGTELRGGRIPPLRSERVFKILVRIGLRLLVVGPRSLCKTEVHLKISEHKMLSFLVRKEIIDNNNTLVVILLSKVGENEFLQTYIAII